MEEEFITMYIFMILLASDIRLAVLLIEIFMKQNVDAERLRSDIIILKYCLKMRIFTLKNVVIAALKLQKSIIIKTVTYVFIVIITG